MLLHGAGETGSFLTYYTAVEGIWFHQRKRQGVIVLALRGVLNHFGGRRRR
jgi:hypothetical protein